MRRTAAAQPTGWMALLSAMAAKCLRMPDTWADGTTETSAVIIQAARAYACMFTYCPSPKSEEPCSC